MDLVFYNFCPILDIAIHQPRTKLALFLTEETVDLSMGF